MLPRVEVRRDDDDRLVHARDHLQRGVSRGLRAGRSSPRAEDERRNVRVLRGRHDLLDRGTCGLAQLDAGRARELGGAAGHTLLGDVQRDHGRIEQAGQVDGGAEHRLRR